jgi:two-component system NtrC family sensor kinase
MHKGGILTITTSSPNSRKKTVQVEIADNGMGIPEKDIPKIFDPFFTSKEKGTGLGLSVVYGVINSHHGTIEVKSARGAGTTIIIRLPLELTATKQNKLGNNESRISRPHSKKRRG